MHHRFHHACGICGIRLLMWYWIPSSAWRPHRGEIADVVTSTGEDDMEPSVHVTEFSPKNPNSLTSVIKLNVSTHFDTN